MNLKIIAGVGFIGFLFLISVCLLVSANSDCPESEKTCVELIMEEVREQIKPEGYDDCLKQLEYEHKMQECLKERSECEIFSNCLRANNITSCLFMNGIPDCGFCLNEWYKEQDCIKMNQEKYGYEENETNCYGGIRGGVRSIKSNVANGCPLSERVSFKSVCVKWGCDYPGDTLCIKWKGESDTQCSSASKNFDINKYKEELERCYFVNCVEDDIFGLDYEEINCFDDMPGKEEEEEVIIVEPAEEEISCSHCPSGCELDYSIDKDCGECICPKNYGFCQQSGLRDIINETSVYCITGLWFAQKEYNQICQNSFECLSNFCSKGICYDISLQVEENKSILQSILDWIRKLFYI